MSEPILVSHHDTAGRELSQLLRDAGHPVLEAADPLATLALLGERPALLVLDHEAIDERHQDDWKAVVRSSADFGAPCLLFSSRRSGLHGLDAPFDGAAAILPWPADRDATLALIESQLTIRRLTGELALARLQMEKKKQILEESLLSAAHIQQSLLPNRLPMLGNLRLASRFLPWEKVGGDLFNVLQLDEETVMAYVLDVSGHGVSSAMLTVSVYQSLSLHTGRVVKRVFVAPPYYEIPPPAEVLEELDLEYPFERFEMFFTITYLLINTTTGQVRFSNAGHPPPVLVRTNGTVELLREGGPIIGMRGLHPFDEGEVILNPGDRLYLYSDGITEYMNRESIFYGEGRLVKELIALKDTPVDASCQKVIDSLYRFGGNTPLQDDVTLLGIEYL